MNALRLRCSRCRVLPGSRRGTARTYGRARTWRHPHGYGGADHQFAPPVLSSHLAVAPCLNLRVENSIIDTRDRYLLHPCPEEPGQFLKVLGSYRGVHREQYDDRCRESIFRVAAGAQQYFCRFPGARSQFTRNFHRCEYFTSAGGALPVGFRVHIPVAATAGVTLLRPTLRPGHAVAPGPSRLFTSPQNAGAGST